MTYTRYYFYYYVGYHQRRRAIEALEARAPPQYCDCGPDWPLLFKVHEICSGKSLKLLPPDARF